MILSNFALLQNLSLFWDENFSVNYLIISHDFALSVPNLLTHYDLNFIQFEIWKNHDNGLIYSFIDQLEDLNDFNNLDHVVTVYHYSIPNVKLAYPEPYIASASLMHNDLWFIHILIYQYWLWFVFIFIIVFFFVTFICTVRWCNTRIRPRRETRGISRSKCGDLITAIVPVSWAASIIINESTDAIDYYDGFATTELVVGIRAYQWGWEYYYPKDIDLNYNIKNNYSLFIGNSLKYNKSSNLNLHANNLWKFYQNKPSDQIIVPAYLLLIPTDNYKLLNFFSFNDIGSNTLTESSAFRRTRMFSKQPLSYFYNNTFSFTNSYNYYNKLYSSEDTLNNAFNYGIKRQHNFIAPTSLSSYHSSFLNIANFNKFMRFNINQSLFSNATFLNQLNISLNELNCVTNLNSEIKSFNINQILNYNNNSDKKNSRNIIFKLLKTFSHFSTLIISNTDVISGTNNNVNKFDNINNFNKNITLYSPGQAIITSEKSIRKWSNLNINNSHFNFSPFNTLSSFTISLNNSINSSYTSLYDFSNSYWMDINTINTLGSLKAMFESPFSPIVSSLHAKNMLDFDNPNYSSVEDVSTILQGKEETTANTFLSAYWNTYWFASSFYWRFNGNLKYFNIYNNFYIPIFHFYYDYDFRNWQNFDLFEDFYWEHSFNLYSWDEYSSINESYYDEYSWEKRQKSFLFFNKPLLKRENIFSFSHWNQSWDMELMFSNNIYFDELLTNLNLNNTNKPALLVSNYNFSNMDDSYDAKKQHNFIQILTQKNLLQFTPNWFTFNTYTNVFNTFRSDFEDFSWFNNVFFMLDKSQLLIDPQINVFFLTNYNFLPYELFSSSSNLSRLDSNFVLRSSIKNALVTYNAIQKVFRSRYDEMRSLARLTDYSNTYDKQLYISSSKTPYELLLGKNKKNVLNINFFKPQAMTNLHQFHLLETGLNFYFFDFPFLMALKSDASRYLWFDWFSKWSYVEIQPASTSRYSIHGMPYFNKFFDYTTNQNELLNETETYLTRITKARKNYLNNWTYSPFFFLKNTIWYNNNFIDELINETDNNLNLLSINLDISDWYWTQNHVSNVLNTFHPSFSNINTYAKSTWKSNNIASAFSYNLNILFDVLTRREYLYKQLFFNSNKLTYLPSFLTNSPSNDLVNDIKSVFIFLDPVDNFNEYSKHIHLSSLQYFHFIVFKSFIESMDLINVKHLTDHFFSYFFNYDAYNVQINNEILYKNQYRPLRKGINNMIRLQATGAIAMPIEIRLQILASSKDVIHSWAIPSAGIKIDCVPGYTSHKVAIFLVSGIFWGQCMEICGRYHHWMPIVVYFMKRDLFFLWCTHFVFLSGANNLWTINDRNFTDYIRVVSYDKDGWINELN